MVAVGYVGGDQTKVSRTGDTMTGGLALLGVADLSTQDDLTVGDDAVVSGDLTVGGSIGISGLLTTNNASIGILSAGSGSFSGNLDVNGVITGDFGAVGNIDVMQLLAVGLSTAIISGGNMSPNVDPTKLDITALTGYIVDYNSTAPLSPTNPLLTYISFPAQIGITPAFAPITTYFVDTAGALVQQPTISTSVERRAMLLIGATATIGGIIIVDQSVPVIPSQVNNQLVDLMENLSPFSTSGNVLSANGVNLTFNKTAGTMFSRAFSQVPTPQNPHSANLAAQAPTQYRTATADPTAFGALTTILPVGSYDPGGLGVITPVGGGANTATNFRIWGFANNTIPEQVLVQYGQNAYSSLTNAVAGLGSGAFTPNPVTAVGALLGWISVIRTATDLSNPAQATFTKASKFATP